MFRIICFCLGFLSCLQIHAQRLNFGEKELTPLSSKEDVADFLKAKNAVDIEWNKNPNSSFPCRLKNKKGYWNLYTAIYKDVITTENKKVKKMNHAFPSLTQENLGFTCVEKDGLWGIYGLFSQDLTDIVFDTIVFENLKESDEGLRKMDSVLSNGGDIYDVEYAIPYPLEDDMLLHLRIAAKKDGLWYRAELREDGEEIQLFLSDQGTKDRAHIPNPTHLSFDVLRLMESMKKEHDLDGLIAEDSYAIYCYGRNENTKQWGLYGGEGTFELIPAEYDSLRYHDNAKCFELWKAGRVYVFDMAYTNLFENQSFDDFEVVFLDYMYGFAVKENNAWKLYDGQTGEQIAKGSAPTIDALIDLWLNRFNEE